jgi:hypothetical protein
MTCCKYCCECVQGGQCCTDSCCSPEETCCNGTCCPPGQSCITGTCSEVDCGGCLRTNRCEIPDWGNLSRLYGCWPGYYPYCPDLVYTNEGTDCSGTAATSVEVPCACMWNAYCDGCGNLAPGFPEYAHCSCAQVIAYVDKNKINTCTDLGDSCPPCVQTRALCSQTKLYVYVYEEPLNRWKRLSVETFSTRESCTTQEGDCACDCPPAPSCNAPDCPEFVSGCGTICSNNEFP